MNLAAARAIVEEGVKTLGIDPSTVMVRDSPDHVSWALKRGSANVLVAIVAREQAATLRVIAPVIVYDAAQKDALFARLLELNAEGMISCAFGVLKDRVVAVRERSVDGLDATEAIAAVSAVAAVADTWDDKLVEQFGGKRASDR